MTVYNLFKNLNLALNKHVSGNSLSPQEFNLLLEKEVVNYFVNKLEELKLHVAQTGGKLDAEIYTSKLMHPYVTSATPSVTTANSITISSLSNYAALISMYCDALAYPMNIEIVHPDEANKRIHNLLLPNLSQYPIAYVGSTYIHCLPYNLGTVQVKYLRYPVTPVFDYYIDANKQIVSLAASASRALGTSEVGSAGQTSGTVNSLTVEMDLPILFHGDFFTYLLSALGVRSRDQLVYQAAENEQAKNKQV